MSFCLAAEVAAFLGLIITLTNGQLTCPAVCGDTNTNGDIGSTTNSVILAGNNNDIIESTSLAHNSMIGAGRHNEVRTSGALIGAGAFNTIEPGTAPGPDIAFGGSDAIIGAGRKNTNRAFYGGILGGFSNNLSGHLGFISGGQWNSVVGDYGSTLGSFCRASDRGSVVISAKTAPRGTSGESGGGNLDPDAPEGFFEVETRIEDNFYCDSKGNNTIHLCTSEEDGFFVNDVNVLAELQRLKNLTESILPECRSQTTSRRRMMDEPCYTNFPTRSPTNAPIPEHLDPSTNQIFQILLNDNARLGFVHWTDSFIEALFDAGYRTRNSVCLSSTEVIRSDVNEELSGNPWTVERSAELQRLLKCPPPQQDLLPIIAASIASTGLVLGILTFLGLNKRVQQKLSCREESPSTEQEPMHPPAQEPLVPKAI